MKIGPAIYLLLGFFVGATITLFSLFSTHALAFTPSDLLSGIGQIKRSTWDNLTRGFALWVLPQGHGWGLDADTVDGFHAASFALKRDFLSFSSLTLGQLSSLNQEISSLDTSLATGELASFFQNASNLVSGTISDSRLSSNVALLNNSQTFTGPKTFSSGTLTVAAGTTLSLSKGSLLDVQGSLSLPPGSITTVDLADSSVTSLKILDGTIVNADVSSSASIAYSKLNLGGSITGSDLSPSIAITTSGAISAGGGVSSSSSLTTTGSGTLSIAGASTLSSSLSVLGASTLAGTTVASLTTTTGLFTSTVPDSSSAIAFSLATSQTYATAGAKLLSIKNNATEALSLNKDGLLTINGNLVSTGTLQGTQLISTASTGTAPLVVSSTTQVNNLNANFVGGYTASQLLNNQVTQPNLVLNSDFGRRNKWMTFMPETFADTNGWIADSGTLGTVSTNILTAGTNGTWLIKAGLSTWRDARFSAQFKMNSNTNSEWGIRKYVDPSNSVRAIISPAGGYAIYKLIGGVDTSVASVSVGALTLNNWYWLELESQGTTYIAKIYSCGASACAKSSATLMSGGTVTGTITDSAVVAGQIAISTRYVGDAASQWGGLSTGNGGVYVEGWGPESLQDSSLNGGTSGIFGGGGAAIGFDETADAGPLGKQWAIRMYIPATSRQVDFFYNGPSGSLAPNSIYTGSFYEQVSGGAAVRFITYGVDANNANSDGGVTMTSAGEASWTRKSGTWTTAATTRRLITRVTANPSANTTGTIWIDLPQVEQGGAATSWRSAPADDDPIVWRMTIPRGTINLTFNTGGTELDPGNTSANLFIPWDASLDMTGYLFPAPGGGGYVNSDILLDTTWLGGGYWGLQSSYSNTVRSFHWPRINRSVTVGKHRVSLGAWALSVNGSTDTSSSAANNGNQSNLTVIATRGN